MFNDNKYVSAMFYGYKNIADTYYSIIVFSNLLATKQFETTGPPFFNAQLR